MIKPRMSLYERYKVRKNIKRILNENSYYKVLYKQQFHSINRFDINNIPKRLLNELKLSKIYINESHRIYTLVSKYDTTKLALVYNDSESKIAIFDGRFNNKLLDIAIAYIESRIGIKRLIDKDFLK